MCNSARRDTQSFVITRAWCIFNYQVFAGVDLVEWQRTEGLHEPDALLWVYLAGCVKVNEYFDVIKLDAC